jgi:signal peptidase I
MMSEENQSKKKGTKDFIDSLIVAFVIAMLIRTFMLSAYVIPSGSMLETLQIGDHILASKVSYIIGRPKAGDIAVFEYPLEPNKDFIKRIIGAPGDRIEIKDKVVYRNGEPLHEPYKQTRGFGFTINIADDIPEFTVPAEFYFVMGDNRDSSSDSRYWGFVHRKSFKGKSFIIYWSKDPAASFLDPTSVRWGRLLNFTR